MAVKYIPLQKVNKFTYTLQDGLDKTTRQIGAECAKRINQRAQQVLNKPRAKVGNQYRRGWTHSTAKARTRVHNPTHYRLAHLLEKGHVIAPYGKRSFFWKGRPHIFPVVEEMREEYFKNCIETVNEAKLEIT